MIEEHWDQFVIYVNAYYAVQEAYDSARRNWERPAEGLQAFCRDANPFLWDTKGSAEESVYQGFSSMFTSRFKDGLCTPEQGFELARAWLATLEGDTYGTALVSSFDATCDERTFKSACPEVARQLQARASHLERTPQDAPEESAAPVANTPSASQINSVIELLAHGDEAFAASLRERLKTGEDA